LFKLVLNYKLAVLLIEYMIVFSLVKKRKIHNRKSEDSKRLRSE
jgi:hypothetical protein